jgi:hypothetical protein
MSANRKLVDDYRTWMWMGPAPNGPILALRDVGTYEIYALDVKWP